MVDPPGDAREGKAAIGADGGREARCRAGGIGAGDPFVAIVPAVAIGIGGFGRIGDGRETGDPRGIATGGVNEFERVAGLTDFPGAEVGREGGGVEDHGGGGESC